MYTIKDLHTNYCKLEFFRPPKFYTLKVDVSLISDASKPPKISPLTLLIWKFDLRVEYNRKVPGKSPPPQPQFHVTFFTRCQPSFTHCITHGRPKKSKQLQWLTWSATSELQIILYFLCHHIVLTLTLLQLLLLTRWKSRVENEWSICMV